MIGTLELYGAQHVENEETIHYIIYNYSYLYIIYIFIERDLLEFLDRRFRRSDNISSFLYWKRISIFLFIFIFIDRHNLLK